MQVRTITLKANEKLGDAMVQTSTNLIILSYLDVF